MQSGCFEDGQELLSYCSRAEEEDHHQSMWEADFDAVDEAISDGFEEDQRLVVFRIEDDLLELAL